MKPIKTHIYIVALIITLCIFVVAFFISSFLNYRKAQELRAIEERIAIEILSFETQFDIIEESSCASFNKESVRSQLQSLSSKLTYLEGELGSNDPEVYRLKRFYSLLQIRDYLLTKRMSDQCNLDKVFLLYFYSLNNCSECTRQQYIVDALKNKYPEIEVYTFDYDIDVPAVETLITLHNIPTNPPIIDINGKVYAPFENLDDIESVLASTTNLLKS